MVQGRNSRLKDRLENYTAAARASGATRTTLGKRLGNWPVYAAATGSAMAMATNASAGVIYSGIQNLTASVSSVGLVGGASTNHGSLKIPLSTANGAGFAILVDQALGDGSLNGAAGVEGFGRLEFLDQSNYSLRKLRFGRNVSTQYGFGAPVGFLKTVHVSTSGTGSGGIWRPGQRRFAAFAFYTNTSANAQVDFGWVRLVYSDSAINGAPDSITAIDWAYDTSGGITTGQVSGGAPEPSTFALALLASGAVGVAALRRRRKVSA